MGDEWEGTGAHLKDAAAVLPGLCDPADQIDLRRIEFVGELPKGARIKTIKRVRRWAVVVYTTVADPGRHSVRIAVLEADSDRHDSFRLVQTATVSEEGFLCGLHLFSTKKKLHFIALVDEPAASSNYLGVYGYALPK